jgi:transposase
MGHLGATAATGPPRRTGRPAVWSRRAIVNAILYADRTGCAWRYLPKDFPPWRTVYGYFSAWRDNGTLQRIHDQLRAAAHAAGRNVTPTAAVIDSQSVRAADTVPKATRGWDQAKKVNGRKRHIAVDTAGLVLAVVVTAASTQDRDAAKPLLWNLRRARGTPPARRDSRAARHGQTLKSATSHNLSPPHQDRETSRLVVDHPATRLRKPGEHHPGGADSLQDQGGESGGVSCRYR